jgi:membrane protein implicated in regulation of membrane protease activity
MALSACSTKAKTRRTLVFMPLGGVHMTNFLNELTGVERIYAACALVGGLLFVIRTLMTLIGGFDSDGDFDLGDDIDVTDVSTESGTADSSFRALSIQGITAFFMMFGLVGLALSRQSGSGVAISTMGGAIAGIGTMWLISRIFKSMQKLQADGTLRYENAIGKDGSVYLTIPAEGSGQVSIAFQNKLRTCDAISADKVEIRTGERVTVVDVVNDNVLVVSKVS